MGSTRRADVLVTGLDCATVCGLQGGGSANYWVGAVDARNREYAQLMRKFQVEANLHDATKRSLSEQLHEKQTLQVSALVRTPVLTLTTNYTLKCI